MKFIIHRGAEEVGGSCVEVYNNLTRLLIDFGLPLDFEFAEVHLLRMGKFFEV